MKGKDKIKLTERAAGALDIPACAVGNVARVTITGRSQVYVEGHGGLSLYGTEEIRVNLDRSTVLQISGRGLALDAMNSREIRISGGISAVTYLQGGE